VVLAMAGYFHPLPLLSRCFALDELHSQPWFDQFDLLCRLDHLKLWYLDQLGL
jgi:hypothetical protein